MKTKNINTKPLLPFKTITEEAMFWDKHSFADYELKYGKLHIAKNEKLTQTINIKVSPTLKKIINDKAQKKHLNPSAFIRSRLVEMLSN